MNGTTVFVKGYSASVRMHVENTECTDYPVPPANYFEPQSHKSLVVNSWNEKKIIPLTASPATGLTENDNATIHNNRFLRRRQ